MTKWVLYYAIFGFIGWVYESLTMTIWSGKWDNRGFLFGPVLPIYAMGGMAVSVVFGYMLPEHTPMQVFAIGVLGSVVLELSTAYVLETIFHQTWWDYSICPFNYKGRICPPASLGFGVAALVVTYFLNPILFAMIDRIPQLIARGMALIYVFYFVSDLAASVYNLKVGEISYPGYNRLNNHMEEFVENHKFMETSISERVHRYMEERGE